MHSLLEERLRALGWQQTAQRLDELVESASANNISYFDFLDTLVKQEWEDRESMALAKRINVPIAICDKRRERPGESEVMNVIGDVRGKCCLLVDDIVDSGGTLINAANALLEAGALEVVAYLTHGVLSGGAVSKITNSRIKSLVITDTIQPTEAVKAAANMRVLSLAPLLAEAIGRTAREESVSSLFY